MIGEVIGKYRVTGKLGEGGMGQVYRVEHELIGRSAALKVLVPAYSRDRGIVTRFFNEARAASAIKHPGIVEILDFGYHCDGSAYILMELLEGETLQARLMRLRVLPADHALILARQVTGALAAAHDQGIVHRDLKPENIFIVADPEVAGGERIKLLDFGIAKLASGSIPGARTETGMVMGTPLYMSPEQCKGAGRVDHRADLYALGCILYQMLCGQPPFTAEGGGEVLAQQIYAPPPVPSALVPGLPAELDALIAELLAKDAGSRPRSARVLMARLDALLRAFGAACAATSPGLSPPGAVLAPTAPTTLSAGAGTVSARPRRTRRRLAVPAAVVIMGVALGGTYALVRGSSELPAALGAAAPASAALPVAPVGERVAPLERVASVASAEPATLAETLAPAREARNPDTSPAPVPAREPVHIEIRIESEPAAVVLHDGERLGRTPLTARVIAGEAHAYVLRRRGFGDAHVHIPADARDSDTVRVTLEPRRRSRRRAAAQADAPDPQPTGAAAQAGAPDPQPTGAAAQAGAPDPQPTGARPVTKEQDLQKGGSLPF